MVLSAARQFACGCPLLFLEKCITQLGPRHFPARVSKVTSHFVCFSLGREILCWRTKRWHPTSGKSFGGVWGRGIKIVLAMRYR